MTKDELKLYSRWWNRTWAAEHKYKVQMGDKEAVKAFYMSCPPGLTIDHIIPLYAGGAHSVENLQYLSFEDNRKKSKQDVAKYGSWMTPEAREKGFVKRRGRKLGPRSEETKAKISAAKLGKKFSDEARRNMSIAAKKRKKSSVSKLTED